MVDIHTACDRKVDLEVSIEDKGLVLEDIVDTRDNVCEVENDVRPTNDAISNTRHGQILDAHIVFEVDELAAGIVERILEGPAPQIVDNEDATSEPLTHKPSDEVVSDEAHAAGHERPRRGVTLIKGPAGQRRPSALVFIQFAIAPDEDE